MVHVRRLPFGSELFTPTLQRERMTRPAISLLSRLTIIPRSDQDETRANTREHINVFKLHRPQNGSHHGRSRFGTPGRVTLNGPDTRSNRASGELHRPGRAKDFQCPPKDGKNPEAWDALRSGQMVTAKTSSSTSAPSHRRGFLFLPKGSMNVGRRLGRAEEWSDNDRSSFTSVSLRSPTQRFFPKVVIMHPGTLETPISSFVRQISLVRATFRPNVVEIVIYKFEFEPENLNFKNLTCF